MKVLTAPHTQKRYMVKCPLPSPPYEQIQEKHLCSQQKRLITKLYSEAHIYVCTLKYEDNERTCPSSGIPLAARRGPIPGTWCRPWPCAAPARCPRLRPCSDVCMCAWVSIYSWMFVKTMTWRQDGVAEARETTINSDPMYTGIQNFCGNRTHWNCLEI